MDVLSRPAPPADHRIHYAAGALQFGDLRIPIGKPGQRFPAVVFVHGGWWQSAYDLEYAGHACAALKSVGIASWSLEYRRVGDPGGGWPGTFQDVAAGFDHLAQLAHSYPLDLDRVITMGHSAGGHLALWLAGRHHIPAASAIATSAPPFALRGVIGLAAAADLRLVVELCGGFLHFTSGKPSARSLMGGLPSEVPERYSAADPGELLPLNVPQVLLQGTEDDQIPAALPARYAENARRSGDHVTVIILPGADHFDVVDPESRAWPAVRNAALQLLGMPS